MAIVVRVAISIMFLGKGHGQIFLARVLFAAVDVCRDVSGSATKISFLAG